MHPYATGGTYNVKLTVTDNDGDTGSVTQPVTVSDPPPNVPPEASFSYTTQFRTASFTGVAPTDGQIASYAWDFGDSSTGTGANPVHPYAIGGNYDVTLTVTDNDGETGSITHPVTVTNPPPEYTWTRRSFGGDRPRHCRHRRSVDADGRGVELSVANGTGRIAGALSNDRAGYLNSVQQRNIDFTTDVTIDRGNRRRRVRVGHR